MRLVWLFPIVGSICGSALYLYPAITGAESAPQQAAAASMAAALGVLPYVIARAIDGIVKVGDREVMDRKEAV